MEGAIGVSRKDAKIAKVGLGASLANLHQERKPGGRTGFVAAYGVLKSGPRKRQLQRPSCPIADRLICLFLGPLFQDPPEGRPGNKSRFVCPVLCGLCAFARKLLSVFPLPLHPNYEFLIAVWRQSLIISASMAALDPEIIFGPKGPLSAKLPYSSSDLHRSNTRSLSRKRFRQNRWPCWRRKPERAKKTCLSCPGHPERESG